MKQMIALLTLLSVSHLSFTQDFQAEFIHYFQQGDTVKQKEILETWENESPKNPEIFTCYFNYYLKKWRTERIRICADTSNGEFFIRDSAGQIVGSYNRQVTYNPDALQKALDKIDEGINLYPISQSCTC